MTMEGSRIYVNKGRYKQEAENDKIECPLLCLIQAWILFLFVYSLQTGVCQKKFNMCWAFKPFKNYSNLRKSLDLNCPKKGTSFWACEK